MWCECEDEMEDEKVSASVDTAAPSSVALFY